ncbi:MAG: diguanylate cyclase [Blautia sp.]|nr:diguanylate cyclase [Blautia sp.]
MRGADWTGDSLLVAASVVEQDAWRIVQGNREFCRLLGVEELPEDQEFCGLFLESDREQICETLARAGQAGAVCEARLLTGEKESRWVELRCGAAADGRRTVVLLDLEQQKKTERETLILQQRYEMMEKLSHEFPFDLDVKGQRILRSSRLMEICGNYEQDDAYYPLEEEALLLHPMDREPFLQALGEASRTEKSGSIDTRFNAGTSGKEPKYLWFRTFYKSVPDEDGNIVRVIGRSFNIHVDKLLQEEVKRDPLTKLLNKVEVQREITSFLESSPSGTHAMFLIDIDNFKGINDTFGHTFGDTVITDVTSMIRSQFRMNDIVGRVGGDEFLVLMKDTTQEKAEEKAERLCQSVSKDYTGDSVSYHISVSVGLSMYGADGNSYSSLFEKADHAMYRAKQGGKNGYELAKVSDVGPIKSGNRSIEKRGIMSRENQEFLNFAVSLMAHARNLDGSLNMLLRRIAERYGLDLVLLLENREEGNEAVLTNYYGKNYEFYEKSVIPLSSPHIRELTAGAYTIFTSEQLIARHEKAGYIKSVKKLDPEEDFCAVVVKFDFIGDHTGEMLFESLNSKREWQEEELDMLQELTRTISVFVSLRYQVDESRAQIQYIQKRDQLTGLYNLEPFKQRAYHILAEAKEDKIYAFEYFDINSFGYVNENYGHKVGDGILKMLVSDVMQQSYFMAGSRLYSDFFLFLLEDDSREALMEHIRGRNQRFLNMLNHQYPNSGMGITAGIYIVEDTRHAHLENAIENANLAWKHAKNAGIRDVVLFEPKLRLQRLEEQQVVGEFFEALYRDDFQVYLQPKFHLKDGRVYGAEALARWKRPDGTVLAPAVFIDSLEKIGYITELDFYIFEELLRTMDRWKKQKRRKLVVSTNFSGRHFGGDGEEFLGRVSHILAKYNVSPANVEIEVTEGVLVKNIGTLQRCVDKLHEMGFRVAIDDFGTGYSSLSMLADIAADVVKIDKSFINKDMSERKLSLLYEIGRMVRILGKEIIIEGVETKAQAEYLTKGGFTCGQGYLCNRPLPLGEFEKLYL